MSIEQYVYLSTSQLPEVEQWQRAIVGLGFDLILDPDVDLNKHSGFWPMTYKGRPTGSEYYFDGLLQLRSLPHNAHARRPSRLKTWFRFLLRPQGPDRFGLCARDAGWPVVAFRFGSDPHELVAAVVAGAVLAKMSDGYYYEAEADCLWTGDEAIDEARKLVNEVEQGPRDENAK